VELEEGALLLRLGCFVFAPCWDIEEGKRVPQRQRGLFTGTLRLAFWGGRIYLVILDRTWDGFKIPFIFGGALWVKFPWEAGVDTVPLTALSADLRK
jgi:hypothetical protein